MEHSISHIARKINVRNSAGGSTYEYAAPGCTLPTKEKDYEKMSGEVTTYYLQDLGKETP